MAESCWLANDGSDANEVIAFDVCGKSDWLFGDGEPMLANDGDEPIWRPFAASSAALYDDDGAKDGDGCCKNEALESEPNEDGELIDEPKDGPNCMFDDGDDCGPLESEPNEGIDGERE